MLDLSVIAAWGDCHGQGAQDTLNLPGEGEPTALLGISFTPVAQDTLNLPGEGETLFFYRAGHGIIARGRVEGQALPAQLRQAVGGANEEEARSASKEGGPWHSRDGGFLACASGLVASGWTGPAQRRSNLKIQRPIRPLRAAEAQQSHSSVNSFKRSS